MKKYKKLLKIVGIFIIIITMCMYMYDDLTDMSDFEISFYQIQSDKVTSNIRIVQLSDLHLNEFGLNNSALIRRIGSLKPDMIALTGDMNNQENLDLYPVLELCKKLVGIAPVYYVMGNNENYVYAVNHSTIIDDIRETGTKLLNCQTDMITIKEDSILIGGLTDEPSTYNDYYAPEFIEKITSSDDSMLKILLVHYPEYFDNNSDVYLGDKGFDIALCGHAHGGHIILPKIGPVYSTGQGWLPKLTEGCQEIGGTDVVISRGLGNNHIIPRFNNKPELVVIDIGWY